MAPKYPRQQLKSASIEVSFPGQLEIVSQFGTVQREMAEKLGLIQLFVPNIQPGEAPALRPFQLRNEEGTRSLAVSVNQVTFIALDEYPGFDDFRAEGIPVIERCLDLAAPPKLNRVRFAYENEIGLPTGGAADLSRYFPGVVPAAAKGWNLSAPFHSSVEWLQSEDRVGYSARMEELSPVFRVGISASAMGPFDRKELGAAVDRTHSKAVQLFENVIGDEFRELISERDR